MKPVFYPLLCAFFFLSCTHRNGYQVTRVATGPFTAYKNVLYGLDTTQQILDVYLPNNLGSNSASVVVLIHGGAWVQGEKEDFDGTGLDTFFTANGYAVVNMNYRLSGLYKYPAPLDDVGLVVDFIRQKAADWKINPDRICLMGKSSGSQLALLYAYSRNQSQRVKVVVDGFGPTDFTDTSILEKGLSINVAYWLGTYSSYPQLWHDASPIFYMSNAVPTVIFQGTEDTTVYPIQSIMLEDSLQVRGKPYMYVPWVGDRHGWDQDKWNQSKDSVLKWIGQYL